MWHFRRKTSKQAHEEEERLYEKYQRLASFPLFALSLMFLVAFIISLDSTSTPTEKQVAGIIMPLTWLAFAIDYAIGLTLSEDRLHFMKSHVIQATALLFPPLRVLLLGHAFTVLRNTPLRRGDRARTYVLYLTTLTLVMCAIMVVFFERRDPNANLTSFGDALWWGGETVSTVGYGDFYPVTVGGRIVAGVLFVNGVALLSIITAGLAQNFTSDDARKSAGAPPAAKATDPPPHHNAAAATASATASDGSATAAVAPSAGAAAADAGTAGAAAADAGTAGASGAVVAATGASVPAAPAAVTSEAGWGTVHAQTLVAVPRDDLDRLHERLAELERMLTSINSAVGKDVGLAIEQINPLAPPPLPAQEAPPAPAPAQEASPGPAPAQEAPPAPAPGRDTPPAAPEA